ncbi:hypothetical protein L596_016148 [Steinernema carpocapsae]|uniref:Uncharacterized protein n=1 Tax=Steinernema carpocapsae TaxID=34508 RepID=A0A4U5NH53_STECR|nr:hypothetical protein L596_016148 [Steinernema carpocapsae]
MDPQTLPNHANASSTATVSFPSRFRAATSLTLESPLRRPKSGFAKLTLGGRLAQRQELTLWRRWFDPHPRRVLCVSAMLAGACMSWGT